MKQFVQSDSADAVLFFAVPAILIGLLFAGVGARILLR